MLKTPRISKSVLYAFGLIFLMASAADSFWDAYPFAIKEVDYVGKSGAFIHVKLVAICHQRIIEPGKPKMTNNQCIIMNQNVKRSGFVGLLNEFPYRHVFHTLRLDYLRGFLVLAIDYRKSFSRNKGC